MEEEQGNGNGRNLSTGMEEVGVMEVRNAKTTDTFGTRRTKRDKEYKAGRWTRRMGG